MSSTSATGAAAPIFLFGMERSGTTMVSLLVGAHPLIAVPYPVAGLWYELADRFAQNNQPLIEQDCRDLITAVLSHQRISDWDVRLDFAAVEAQRRGQRFSDIQAAVYQAYAAAKDKPRWAQMDIATIDHIAQVARWFPDARFVHLVRDGRDVALSHQTMPYGAGNIRDCALAWQQRMAVCRALGDLIGPERFYHLRYEDLILSLEPTLKDLCAFLNVDFSPRMLAYRETIDEKVPDDRLWLWPNLRQPPDPNKVARWKREMRPAQRLVFEDIAGNALAAFGYEHLEHLPKSPRAELLGIYYQLLRGGRWRRLKMRLGIRSKTPLERGKIEG